MTTAGAGRPPKCGVAIQTATPVGEPCAMARTADSGVPPGTPAGISGSNLLISMGSRSCRHLRSLLAAPGDDCRGISRACGTLNRAGGVSVLLVVSKPAAPVPTRSGTVILPRNRMPLTPLIEPPKP